MTFTVQVVVDADGAGPVVVREVFSLKRGALSPDTLGLGLAEANDVLAGVQATMGRPAGQRRAGRTGGLPGLRETSTAPRPPRTIVMRTLFGTLRLPSPRRYHCSCRPHRSTTFSPLTVALAERSTPELVYLESRFAAVMSFGLTAKLLAEALPLGRMLYPAEARRHPHAVAGRLEDELGPEQPTFIETGPDQQKTGPARICPVPTWPGRARRCSSG